MRILLLATRFPDEWRPNFGKFVAQEALALAALPNVAVRVVAPAFEAEGAPEAPAVSEQMWKELPTCRPRVPRLAGPQEDRPVALAASLVPTLDKLRTAFPFDIVSAEFAWPEGPAAVAIGQAFGIPVVIKARGMDFEKRLSPEPVRARLLAAMRAAAGLVAVSADMKETMVGAGLPADGITVIRAGVDSDLFGLRDRRAAKASFGVDGPLLLCVGNLIPTKGQDLAIDALARMPDARLFILGNGPEVESLRRRAERLGVAGRVRFFGSVPHALLPAFYAAADVTVHASSMEGFPNVRLESLACGTPLVTTAVGDASHVMRTPAAGRIVPAEAGAIAEAIRAVLAAPAPPEEVRANVLDYGWTGTAERLNAILRRIVAGPSA